VTQIQPQMDATGCRSRLGGAVPLNGAGRLVPLLQSEAGASERARAPAPQSVHRVPLWLDLSHSFSRNGRANFCGLVLVCQTGQVSSGWDVRSTD
jgi:hypothetical protein